MGNLPSAAINPQVPFSSRLDNTTRMGAGLDCEHGRYNEGIATMEALLRSKNFDVPPPTGIEKTVPLPSVPPWEVVP